MDLCGRPISNFKQLGQFGDGVLAGGMQFEPVPLPGTGQLRRPAPQFSLAPGHHRTDIGRQPHRRNQAQRHKPRSADSRPRSDRFRYTRTALC